MRLYGTLQELSSLTIRLASGDTVQVVAAEQSHASGAVSVTIPDLGASSASDEIVMVTLGQTLLNKTLTSPVMTNVTLNSSLVLQIPTEAPGTGLNAIGRLYYASGRVRVGTSTTDGAFADIVTATSSDAFQNKTMNLSGGTGNSISEMDPLTAFATSVAKADGVVRYDASGIPNVGKISNANVAANADIAGSKLLNNSISVGKLVTAETTGTGSVVLQSSPTLGTVVAESGTLTVSGTGALRLPVGNASTNRPAGTAAQLKGMIRYNDTDDAFEGYNELSGWSALGGGGTSDRVTQASHGFVIGDILWMNGSNYEKAKADAANTAEVVGMVSRIIDASTFELTLSGEVAGLAGLTPGEVYFLSAATAGALTITEPSVVGQVSLPVGVASSETSLYVAPKRGVVVGAANVRTTITLSNGLTTTVQNVSAYDAGELSGWVYIDATADRRFYVTAQFAKKGDGTGYWCSFQTTGDTPPAGFSMDVTTAGAVHTLVATMPSVAGFSSANINFALNAPAVGATLPLQISGALVTGPVLGAGTGAAIPAGYVGHDLSNLAGAVYSNMTSSTYNALGTRTLTDGVYVVSAQVGWLKNGAAITGALGVVSVSTNTRGYSTSARATTSTVFNIYYYDAGEGSVGVPAFIVRVQNGTMYFPDGSTSAGDTTLKVAFYPGSFTGGPFTAQGLLTVLRIN